MGFYGNITDTTKTTFSFDLVYSSRYAMDDALSNSKDDGVFLGRYVLVDYDDAPIKAYGKKDSNGKIISFYNTPIYSNGTKIEGKVGVVYEDLQVQENTVSKFYVWNGASYVNLQEKTPYYSSFETDVAEYGRGYDSTVWVKRYDVETNRYKYAMIAELNAVVPTLHLVIEKPNPSPMTPYFDRDTTNIDYYLHTQGEYGTRVKRINDNKMRSDENIIFKSGQWVNQGGYSVWQENAPQDVKGDIYYNDAGFDPEVRTYSEGSVTYHLINDQGEYILDENNRPKTATVDYSKNQIGYDYGRSGRYYGPNAELGVYSEGYQADDIYDWFIRLPGIGNAICKMWDKIYGYNADSKRFMNDAQTYEDTEEHLVTYDRKTMMGVMNTAQDLIGYHFVLVDGIHSENHILRDPEATITDGLNYSYGDIGSIDTNYKVLDCIFYSKEDGKTKYYCYTYCPSYGDPVTPDFTSDNQYFYKDSNGVYHLANAAAYKATDANGNLIPETAEYYLETPLWKLTPIDTLAENNIYSLIAKMHQLMGTNIETTRSFDSVQGSINAIKDVISNIDINLIPGKLLHTNNNGIIETTKIFYPSSDVDATRVLIGQPTGDDKDIGWENRLRSVKVVATNGSETNWSTASGTIDSNINNNNELVLQSGNKWIGLEVDTGNAQSITFKHLPSTQAEHDFATDIVINDHIKGVQKNDEGVAQTDCIFTFPMLETDNAGHVIGYTVHSIYIPYNYRNINLSTQSTSQEAINLNTDEDPMKQSADFTNDNFTFSTGNQWIEARIDEDQITFAHALVNDKSEKEWEFKATATEQWQSSSDDGNKLTIPTFETDHAGHIVRQNSVDFYIPNNFREIKILADKDADAASTSVTVDTNLKADSAVDVWSIASQNKWIDIAANADEDAITIGHKYSEQEAHDFKNDVTIATALDGTTQKDNLITLPFVQTDNAGHVTDYTTSDFYVPHTFKTITVDTDVTEENATFSTPDTLEADNIIDGWSIGSQNKWIKIAAYPNDDKITIGHALSKETSQNDTGDTANQTPEFGATFKVPNYETDKAGHITASTAHTVKIPQNSYSETANKNVLTSIALNQNSGTFTGTRVNVGTLAIGEEYVAPEKTLVNVKTSETLNTIVKNIDTAIVTEKDERVAAITAEKDERVAAVESAIETSKTYTNTEITKLVNSAPETLDTLYELAAALGNDENFATSVNTLIGENKQAIAVHIADKNNPHEVTKAQVGLGNVDNESKATMFTDPEFTGIPTAPTAALNTNTTQIATTEFVLANSEAQINIAVQKVLDDLLVNYGLVLTPPRFTATQDNAHFEILVDENQAGTFSYNWYQKVEGQTLTLVTDPVPMFDATEAGIYECVITRTHNTHTSTASYIFTATEDMFNS